MTHFHLPLVAGLFVGCQIAAAFEPGEKVVVVQPVEMKTINGSTLPLTMGTAVTVQESSAQVLDAKRLKVAVGRVGWIDAAAIVPVSEADDRFSKRIAEDAQDAAALLARGKVRFDKGDIDAAIADFDRSLALRPSSEGHTLRGYAWKRKGDKQRAMADFDAAIALNPNEALAWRVRGATWAGMADYRKAVAEYSESIRVDPENTDSLHHRALMLSACNEAAIRNGAQAVKDATKACELSEWKNPLYLSGLAIASAEAGDFDAAVKWQTKAIEFSTNAHGSAQLELFKQRQPFRMTWR